MDLLTIDQTAELLCVSVRTIRRLMAAGTGPSHYLISGQYRFRRYEVLDWLETTRGGLRHSAGSTRWGNRVETAACQL